MTNKIPVTQESIDRLVMSNEQTRKSALDFRKKLFASNETIAELREQLNKLTIENNKFKKELEISRDIQLDLIREAQELRIENEDLKNAIKSIRNITKTINLMKK